MAEVINFALPVLFHTIPVGGRFISVFTTCNDIVIRVTPTKYKNKMVNARRPNGKLIFVAEWEPVFIEEYKPERIQRKRSKGWRMPPNTVYIGRPSKHGNPFSLSNHSRR